MQQAAFAVTTRSGLRSVRFFPSMFIASLRVKRQLKRTPGVVRWASIVAGPREFWTVTVWESRDKMLEFMRSGAHEDIMWEVGKWLQSFWLMRWRPTTEEHGGWDGANLAAEEPKPRQRQLSQDKQEALDAALDALPHLKASAGPDGKATYEDSPYVRRHRDHVAGGGSVMVRLAPPRFYQGPRAWWDLRRVRKRLRRDATVLRWVSGLARPREMFLLAVLRDGEAGSRFLHSSEHQEVADRWGDAYWVMRWEPANEFGHWDGLRLRRERLGQTAIPVPDEAAKAAEMPGPTAARIRPPKPADGRAGLKSRAKSPRQ